MNLAFQVFQEVLASTVEHSATLATTVSGGVRQRTVLQLLGAAACITMMVMQTEAATLRKTVFQFVASGIRLFGSLTLCPFDNLTPQGSIFEKYEITQ
jgi:L-lactate permease